MNKSEILSEEIPTQEDKMSMLEKSDHLLADAMACLKMDNVVLVRNMEPSDADEFIAAVADALGLRDQLEIQAGFASIQGHRKNVGRYYMTVNKRDNYEFIPPHSEGSSAMNMQIASFYCHENSTDGGESILFNANSESSVWEGLKELSRRVVVKKNSVSAAEKAQAKMMYQIDLEKDLLTGDDQIVQQLPTPAVGFELYQALSRARKTYSRILDKDVFTYWDTIASVDFDSAIEYFNYLMRNGLIHQPAKALGLEQLDNAHNRRVWRSGVKYNALFKGKLVYKLAPGEFILMNNLTWAHSANNWTPGSGVRRVAAAFA